MSRDEAPVIRPLGSEEDNPQPFGEIIADFARRYPDSPAITFEGATTTWAELEARTNRLARYYANLGVLQDTLVTIAIPNSTAFYESAIATLKLGATPQPVSYRLPLRELQAIVDLANPSLLVGGSDRVQTSGARIEPSFAAAENLSCEPLPTRIANSWRAPTSGGSTGRPKLILSKQRAEFAPERPFMGMEDASTQLVAGPLYHNAPFSLSIHGLTKGHHLVVMPRFDAERTLALIEQYRVDWTLLVPTMMSRIWRLDKAIRSRYDISSLKHVWHMAAPCPDWLKQAWIDLIGAERLWELYGGTEGQGVTVIRGDEWLDYRGSVGKPLPGYSMKICSEDGETLKPGEIGEIYMRPDTGQGSTYSYIGAEPKALDDGFESLGDIGWMNEEGYLFLADRKTDMILSGGANIYPAEVEAQIEAHPSVLSVAVIGLPDEDMGQIVHAIVQSSKPVAATDLSTWLSDRLVGYKIPRSYEFVAEPLRDDAGKVRRGALREARIK